MALTNTELAAAVAASVFPEALLPKRYDLNDMMSDMGHVEHLLDAASTLLSEQNYGSAEDRNHDLDRINAMVWMARDMVERLNALSEVYYTQIGSTTANWGQPK